MIHPSISSLEGTGTTGTDDVHVLNSIQLYSYSIGSQSRWNGSELWQVFEKRYALTGDLTRPFQILANQISEAIKEKGNFLTKATVQHRDFFIDENPKFFYFLP